MERGQRNGTVDIAFNSAWPTYRAMFSFSHSIISMHGNIWNVPPMCCLPLKGVNDKACVSIALFGRNSRLSEWKVKRKLECAYENGCDTNFWPTSTRTQTPLLRASLCVLLHVANMGCVCCKIPITHARAHTQPTAIGCMSVGPTIWNM